MLQSKTNFPSEPGHGLLIETSGTPRIWESPKDKTKLHNVLKQRGVIVLPVKDFSSFSVKQTEFQQKKTSLFSQFWLVSTNQNKKDRNTMKYAPLLWKDIFLFVISQSLFVSNISVLFLQNEKKKTNRNPIKYRQVCF